MQTELKELFIDKKPKPQEVFDFVVSKIIHQGQPSTVNGSCAYRGPDGLRCAAGWLLPDEAYDRSFNRSSIVSSRFQSNVKRYQAYWLKSPSRFFNLIKDLQRAHDDAVFDNNNFLKYFKTGCESVAALHKLNTKVLDV